jgi:sugar phosphate isomerase/epimerase
MEVRMSIADELSIQLYSMREYGDLDRQLDALGEIGFRQVETVGGHLADAAATRAKLDARGMQARTGHIGMADLRARPDWVAEQAKVVGIEQLYMPAVPPDERQMDDAGWRRVGEELGRIADRLSDLGVRLGYHNHAWEVQRYPDGSMPLEHLLEASRNAPLSWQADIAWIVRGGADPMRLLNHYQDRLTSVHVKDLAPEGRNLDEDGWCDVGAGTLDWPRLWAATRKLGASHMVLEHDKPKDPVAFARNSRAFILEHCA